MESAENQRISCRVTQLYNVKPEDSIFPWYMFSLDISTTFINYSDRQIFLVDRRKVLDEKTSRSNLLDLLLEMNVPVLEDGVHASVINPILDSAKTMASSECLKTRKILRLRIEIDVRMSLDDDDVVMAASESSIEALERVRMELLGGHDDCECVICLQQLEISSTAIRLPCSHLYHDTCILFWLKSCNGVCPLCRLRIVG